MPTLSMTGFGDGRAEHGAVEVVVEMKSVNHRFLDVACKLPNVYSRFETDLGKLVRGKLRRGRIELYIGRKENSLPEYELRFNKELFNSYLNIAEAGLKEAKLSGKDSLSQAVVNILGKREVVELAPKEVDTGEEFSAVAAAVEEALGRLIEMRVREGAELEKEVLGHLNALKKVFSAIDEKAQAAPEEVRRRLLSRLEALPPEIKIDESRLVQEAAVLADRVDVTEERARLHSHAGQFEEVIAKGEGGRRLEFLLQEMGREINTVGSKAQDSEVTASVVEAKALMEKLREQVANIE